MADTDLTVAVCIITGFGINTDREMAQAFALAGGRPERVHVNDLIADPARLDSFRIFVIPGGFSFGDHIGSGAMLAALMTRTLPCNCSGTPSTTPAVDPRPPPAAGCSLHAGSLHGVPLRG